jgi:nitrogen permease regulator 3-like protein
MSTKRSLSFHQVAQSNILTLGQVRKYAQHFIYWRRAIAIPPLHARDVYVLSPNCDSRRLALDTQDWQRAFPVAPPLPNFLSELSQSPRPFKHFSPSKAHRPSYLLMLAWLMRRGWVTQLCTFAYVIVWPEIIYEVDYEIEAEEFATAAAAAAAATSTGASAGPDQESKTTKQARSLQSPSQYSVDSGGAIGTSSIELSPSEIEVEEEEEEEEDEEGEEEQGGTPEGGDDELKNHNNTSHDGKSNGNNRNISSNNSGAAPNAAHPPSAVEHAAEAARLERIANKAHLEATQKVIAHARRVVPHATAHPSLNDAHHLNGLTPHIILDAKKATGRESRYLSAIAGRFKDPRISAAWQQYCKYFDGRSALERIALQEDVKRKEVWTQLTAMTEYLLCTRHW